MGTTTIRVEGDLDSGERFGTHAALGAAPTIAADRPGAAFLSKVELAIAPPWESFVNDCRSRLSDSHTLNSQTLVTTIRIVTDSSGKIVALEPQSKSGNAEFDEVALEVVREVRQLPAAPPEWISDDGLVYLTWSFASDERQAGSASASISRVELPIAEAVPLLLKKQRVSVAIERILQADVSSEQGLLLLRDVARVILAQASTQGEPDEKKLALQTIRQGHFVGLTPNVRLAASSPESQVVIASLQALGALGKREDHALILGILHRSAGLQAESAVRALLSLQGESLLSDTASLQSDKREQQLSGLAVVSVIENEGAVPAILTLINSRDRGVRLAAIRALGFQSLHVASAKKALIAAIQTPDAITRVAVMAAIGEAAARGMRSRNAYWKIVEMIGDRDQRVASAAIVASARLEPVRFAKELPRVLRRKFDTVAKGELSEVEWSVLRILPEIDSKAALAKLISLASHSNAQVRLKVARGLLRKKSNKAAAGALRALVQDSNPEVRAASLVVLTNADSLRPVLDKDPSPLVQAAALGLLAVRFGRQASAKITIQKLAAAKTATARSLWIRAWVGER